MCCATSDGNASATEEPVPAVSESPRNSATVPGGSGAKRGFALPQAVIALKQGAGRLIRNESDRGVLVLCDPRLTSKTYGSVFLNSLPPLPRTRRVEDVQAFFAPEEAAAPLESTP